MNRLPPLILECIFLILFRWIFHFFTDIFCYKISSGLWPFIPSQTYGQRAWHRYLVNVYSQNSQAANSLNGKKNWTHYKIWGQSSEWMRDEVLASLHSCSHSPSVCSLFKTLSRKQLLHLSTQRSQTLTVTVKVSLGSVLPGRFSSTWTDGAILGWFCSFSWIGKFTVELGFFRVGQSSLAVFCSGKLCEGGHCGVWRRVVSWWACLDKFSRERECVPFFHRISLSVEAKKSVGEKAWVWIFSFHLRLVRKSVFATQQGPAGPLRRLAQHCVDRSWEVQLLITHFFFSWCLQLE